MVKKKKNRIDSIMEWFIIVGGIYLAMCGLCVGIYAILKLFGVV